MNRTFKCVQIGKTGKDLKGLGNIWGTDHSRMRGSISEGDAIGGVLVMLRDQSGGQWAWDRGNSKKGK